MFLPLEFYEGISLHIKKHKNISLVKDPEMVKVPLIVDHLGRKPFRINVVGWFSSS
jgi:hypothetical protein